MFPAEHGYRWPAEWEPHAATWLSWPHNRKTWPNCLAEAQQQYSEMARTIAMFEPVNLLVCDAHREQAESFLGGVPGIEFHAIATNDAWIRDHGPCFLTPDKAGLPPAMIHWKYNAWGNRYPHFDQDAQVPENIAAATGHRLFTAKIVLEGGAIDGNGGGVLLKTDSCPLHQNRNPDLTAADFEQIAADWLGSPHVIWLTGEVPGDDTDSHIDQIARFADAKTVLLVNHPENNMAQENERRISEFARSHDVDLTAIQLPSPNITSSTNADNGQRPLPASYANFYILNGAVIVPVFQDPADDEACEIIASVFPDRELIQQPSDALIVGLGSVHCLTQQEPLSLL